MNLEHLKTIKWKSVTVFQENSQNLVVLECENKQQAMDFMNLLLQFDFNFSIDRNLKFPKLNISFDNSGFKVSAFLKEDILTKYFSNKNINSDIIGIRDLSA